MLNERQRKLLTYIKQLERPCTVEELSTYFAMSERTIRNDIKLIRLWGEEHQIPIHFKNSHLHIGDEAKPLLKQLLNVREDIDSITNTPLTRQLYIILTLLMTDEYVSLTELAEQFSTSKSTIVTDMKGASEWLKKLQISIISKRHGYFIEVDELRRRLAMINVMEWLEYSYKSSTPYNYIAWMNLSYRDIQYFNLLYKELGHNLVDVDIPLYVSLLVQFERIKNGTQLSESDSFVMSNELSIHTNHVYESNTIDNFYEKLNMNISKTESAFIPIISYLYCRNYKDSITVPMSYSTHKLIDHLIEQLGLGEISDETWPFLVNESTRLFEWHRHKLYRFNPLFPITYSKYRIIFNIIENCQQQLVQWSSIPLHMWTEIVLLLAGELELQQHKHSKIRAILVCPSGSATSYFLEKRLQRYFPTIHIVTRMSVEQLMTQQVQMEYDFIISTVLINEMNDRVVVIPPLIDEKQIEILHHFIRKYEQQKLIENDSIYSIIPEDCIQWLKETTSIEQLMIHGSRILQNKGIVNEQVQRELLATYEKFGMYFELMPGLIMPHIISQNVSKVGISCICLKQPLLMNGKQIYTAITLVSPNDKEHVSLLNNLYELLSKTKTVQELNILMEKRKATYEP